MTLLHLNKSVRHGFTRALFACMAILFAINSYGVTDKEMEQARTIAAQTYLRYANDGSGYLDDHHPATMAELQKILKAKEKENIKAFMGVAVPKDYASWDKAKLVEYWSVTAFKAPGLTEKGKGGKSRARSRLQAMKVSDPASAKVEEPKVVETKGNEGKTAEEVVNDPAATQPEEKPVETLASVADSTRAAAQAEMAALSEEIALTEEAEAAAEDVVVKKSDNTWLYIVILCVLIAIVVALVIFASSTMKRRGSSDETPEERDRRLSGDSALADGLRAENEGLKRELDAARTEAMRWRTETTALRERVRTLEDTLESLSAASEAKGRGAGQSPAENSSATLVAPAGRGAGQSPAENGSATPVAPAGRGVGQSPAENGSATRKEGASKIYLGRVNARGLFVRADRGLNPEGSVYVLETEDGFSGSFRVVRNREVWKRLLSNPGQWLEGGCIIRETEDVTPEAIVTESAGTAVFEDSCWRVIRKARVRFE